MKIDISYELLKQLKNKVSKIITKNSKGDNPIIDKIILSADNKEFNIEINEKKKYNISVKLIIHNSDKFKQ